MRKYSKNATHSCSPLLKVLYQSLLKLTELQQLLDANWFLFVILPLPHQPLNFLYLEPQLDYFVQHLESHLQGVNEIT